jgi:hypothetical protein
MAHYYKHPDLVLPEDSYVIWRYMDLWKFHSMLQSNSIFFSRVDKQKDTDEGKFSLGMLIDLEKEFKDGLLSKDGNKYTLREWHLEKEIRSRLISCWSMDSNQSQKKWCEYTSSKESIVIRSTIERLKDCFHVEGKEERVVWIGKVRYGEEENRLHSSVDRRDDNHWLYPFFAKKEYLRWEREVRATVNIALNNQPQFGNNEDGCFVKADLQKLIDSVWIHPQAPSGLVNQVREELDKYGLVNVSIFQAPWDSLMP